MKKRKYIWFIVLLVIVAVLATFAIIRWRQIKTRVDVLFTHVDELKDVAGDGLSSESIQSAIEISGELSQAIDDLKMEIEPLLPAIEVFSKMPWAGGYFSNIEPSLDFASNIAKTAVILGRTGMPLIEGDFSNSGSNQMQALYEFFLTSQSSFTTAENYFEKAKVSWGQIDPEYMPEQYKDEISSVDDYLQISSSLFDVLKAIPQLLGSEDHATYLIMIQNKDELRPSGGFITGFGIVQLRAGRILVLEVEDSTTLDYVSEVREPAYPIRELMFANYLVPRDANWSPDFPTAAQETQNVYWLSTGIETDGVFAFDQLFLVSLFDFIGPMTVSEEFGEINAENFEAKMIEYKQQNWEEETIIGRKEFLSILAPELMSAVFKKSEFSDLVELVKIMKDEMEKGHLSIYFNDPNVQKIIESFDLDGSIQPGSGDYIMPVDANVGFGKADQYINRSVEYSVDLSDPTNPESKLVLTYEHTGSQDERCFQGRRLSDYDYRFRNYYFSRCYWDYWRVLLQNGAEIENVQFTEVPEEYFYEGFEWDQTPSIGAGENDTIEVGGLIVVPQSSEQTVQITFKPPENILVEIDEGGLMYSLRVQKENGIDYLPVKVEVITPKGYEPVYLEEGWTYDEDAGILVGEGEIDRTMDFVLYFVESELAADN